MATDNRTALLNLIATLSFKLGDFILASGQKSDYYIDCRITTLHAEGGPPLRPRPLRPHPSASQRRHHRSRRRPHHGADPPRLQHRLRLRLGRPRPRRASRPHPQRRPRSRPGRRRRRSPHPHHGFLVRKARRPTAPAAASRASSRPHARVVIVDDVCTTGGSTITAIDAAREAGMHIAAVLCLVDREQGGRAKIEAALNDPAVPFLSAFTANDVRTAHLALKNP